MKKDSFKRITAFVLATACICGVFYGIASGYASDTPVTAAETGSYRTDSPDAPLVLLTDDISPAGLVNIYDKLGVDLTGNIAVKMSTGEPPNSNYLRPELIGDLVRQVDGTIVECNTAYGGSRSSTAAHWQVIKDHGLDTITEKGADIMDEESDMEIPAQRGTTIHEDYVGSHLANYDSLISLAHFKGHAMAGYGGAIKNMSIGIASPKGKAWIHSGGTSTTNVWGGVQDRFLEAMGDATSGVVDYFNNKGGRVVYINVMNRISVDCDCDGNPSEPDMHDVGILASTDPVALDQACIDIVYDTDRTQSGTLINRIESRNGLYTLEHAEAIGLGSRSYRLTDIDDMTESTTVTTTETTTETTTVTETSTETTSAEEQESHEPMYGDATNDGILTAADSEMILHKVLSSDFETNIEKVIDDWMRFIDVDKSGVLTASDAAVVLQKVLDDSFKMPAEEDDGSNILVVYYSATGSTKRASEFIADETKADMFELKPKDPYTAEDLRWSDPESRVVYEHNNEAAQVVELEENTVPGWDNYKTVFIGYPIWWGNASWVVNGFVKNNDFTGKKVIPFCTSSSSGLGESAANLAAMAGTGNWQTGMRFASNADEAQIREWAKDAVG